MTPAADTGRTPALASDRLDSARAGLLRVVRGVVGLRRHPALPAGLPARAGARAGLDDRRHRLHVLRRHVPVLVAARPPERPHRPQAGRGQRHVPLRARHPAVRDHHERLVVPAVPPVRGHRRGLGRAGRQRLHRRHQQRRDARARLRPADQRAVRRPGRRAGAGHPAEHARRRRQARLLRDLPGGQRHDARHGRPARRRS